MAIENWNRWVFPLKMVIFHSYINVYRRVIYWRLPGKAKKWQWRCAFRPPVTSCDAVFMDTPVAPGMSSPCSYRVKSVNMTYPNPIFPIFFLYSKIHEKSQFYHSFLAKYFTKFFFSLVLMGWFRVLFWKIHTCHIQFMFFIGQIPEKNDRIWICNSNQTTTFRTKVSTSVSIELRRFRHEKHVRFSPPRSSNSPLLSNKISGTSSAPASLGGLGWRESQEGDWILKGHRLDSIYWNNWPCYPDIWQFLYIYI